MTRGPPEDPVRDPDDYLVFGAPAIGEAEKEAILEPLEDGWIGTGPRVERFEEDFRAYKDADHAIATNSCTSALYLSLRAAGLGEGDEVVTTPLTYGATVNAILHAGATPVLADVDPETRLLDPQEVQEAITDDTAALLPVHYTGRPCDMDALGEIADEHDLLLVEDSAHAIEAKHRGQHTGTFGDFGCFSFYATKNVTTAEGGMVLTDDAEAADRIDTLHLHGVNKGAWTRDEASGYQHYTFEAPGWKMNMTDLQAALGIHQLARVDENWERRRAIWGRYQEAFASTPLETPPEPAPHQRHGYHLYTVLVDEEQAGLTRDAFLAGVEAHNVGTGVHYISLPEHSYYQEALGWDPAAYPHARRVGDRTASLPLAPNLDEGDVDDVVEAVDRTLRAG